jgi:hypothetical protein
VDADRAVASGAAVARCLVLAAAEGGIGIAGGHYHVRGTEIVS